MLQIGLSILLSYLYLLKNHLIMSEDQKRQLNQQLWNIANTLRGKMGADEFRDYILGFIFYKYLSEKMEIYANDILKEDKINYLSISENSKEGIEYLEAIREESLEKLGYFLKPSELFKMVAIRGNGNGKDESKFIIEDIQKILINIQNSTMGTDSEEDFDHLFEDMDLNSTKLGKTAEQRNEVIAKVLSHLDKIDFKLEQSQIDVLGDAYEYLIGQFASGAGKKAGEFYTPQQASKILARIVTLGKTRIKSAYDPTCGSGSLILRLGKECEVLKFYGQELNRTTYNLCRMNMILHGVHYSKFDIRLEDTIEHPQHGKLDAEAVVANPPFSAQWSANQLFMTDDRFSEYGRLAPSSKADYAFIQHMVYHLAENGVMAVVMPHGVLFRGAAEGHIRKYLIEEKNYLDAVIGLPANIFFGTSIPTCILVFKKCREQPENILFIDASQHFEKVKTQNYLRDEDVDRIIDTYSQRININKYSCVASLDVVRENDYNLNIPRYVDTYEEEETINIAAIANELKALEAEMQSTDETIAEFCKELKIATPF
jgi:type I restriction enzyme M protein